MFNPEQIARFHTMYTKTETCWLWHRALMNGYGSFSITHWVNNKKRFYINAHRYSYMLHNKITQLQLENLICHTCDVRHCVNPSHLYLGTYADNVKDCESRHRANHVNGERHGRVKLTESIVRSIRQDYLNGDITHRALAERYNTSSSNVSDILSRRRWKHLA